MGRSRKRFGAKAREPVAATEPTKALEVEVNLDIRQDKYDGSNALVLPSKKKKEAVQKAKEAKSIPKLSKKKKKELQKVLERKKKKVNRTHLLEELEKSQASKKELSMLISTSTMQTKGLKRLGELTSAEAQPTEKVGAQINSIKGSRPTAPKRPRLRGSNVLDLDPESSEDSSSGDDSSEEENNEERLEQYGADREATGSGEEKSEEDDSTEGAKNDVAKSGQEEAVATNDLSQNRSEPSATKPKPPSRPAVFVPVHRTEEIQNARHQLPILTEEQSIMEAINENDIVVICGQTGSGKTTQVPQFLYEAGYASQKGIIGITEPRRVAAVSMSKRVGQEMSLPCSVVSYQIRFEGNTTEDTKVKFMTDGVLLKEIQNNFLLTKYSVVIIDEAHERSIYSDILIGLLSRIVPTKHSERGNPLKLIIMSATLRVEDFTQNSHLFKVPPPVDSRQHPVTIHFNKRTPDDYLQEAYRKVCKIHQQLPEGAILVFVTGQQEVQSLCHKLRKRYPAKQDDPKAEEVPAKEATDPKKDGSGSSKSDVSDTQTAPASKQASRINLDDYSVVPLDEGQLEDIVKDEEREDGVLSSDNEDEEPPPTRSFQPLMVLPLFSLLPSHKQAKVFQNPPPGMRLCVVATNVGETSLTIPNVKYVVDTGKVKMRVYDKVTGISAFMISWVSKASADQRAGRAGRTCPGHCYRQDGSRLLVHCFARLYSSAIFNDEFQKFTAPEITRRPVDDLVLQMKAMNIDKVVNFPYPSPPDKEALKAAEKKLILMGALEELPKPARFKDLAKWEWSSKVTPLGRAMSCFPVSPRYAKMLALSQQHGLLPYVVAVVAAMTVQEVFCNLGFSQEPHSQEKHTRWKKVRETWAGQGHSLALGDVMVLLKAVGASEFVGCSPSFCEQHGLRYKAMVEIRKLRIQLTNELRLGISNSLKRCGVEENAQFAFMNVRGHIVPVLPERLPWQSHNRNYSTQTQNSCFDHLTIIFSKSERLCLNYEALSVLYIAAVVAEVEPEWLPVYAPKACTFSAPLEDPPPHYDKKKDKVFCFMTSTFGPHGWKMEAAEHEFPVGLDRFRWFARFLLEGQVLPFFKSYTKLLLSPPVTMVKSWARLQPRTEHLLKALVSQSADSKEKLCEAWKKNPKYLLSEYLEWIQESLHNEVSLKWPPSHK
ncbi:unnamed protein product [Ixodes persulcatus]